MSLTLRLAWRNLWRHRRRTWLTTGAMVFSNIILVFMISLQLGMYDMMINNTLSVATGHVQIQAPGYNAERRMRDTVGDIIPLATELREVFPGNQVSARAAAFALASSESRSFGIQVFGVEPQHEPQVSTLPGLVSRGRYLSDLNAAEAVIGSVLARNLHVGLGDELTLLGSGRDGSFAAGIVTVAGIFESGMTDVDRSIAQLPLGYFQDMFSMEGSGHSIVFKAPALDNVAPLYVQLQQRFKGRDDIAVLDWDELEPGLRQAIQADMSSAMFMYGILVVLVAFSVLNTLLMSVLERTREFGIMMALGLKPIRLGRLVVLEATLMGLLGLGLGVLLGCLLTLWVGYVGFTYPGMDEMAGRFNLPSRIYPEMSLVSVMLGPGAVFIGCLLAAIFPAMRLRRMQPVEAMRAA